MTGEEKKWVRYKRLIADVNNDLDSIRKNGASIKEIAHLLKNEQGPIRGSDLMACAGYLHHYYTGIESLFERISRAVDGGPTSGGDYHRELLRSMTIEIPDIRPSIITRDLAEELDEYRRFRHMFRHSYGSELRWRKMEPLAMEVDSITEAVDESITRFVQFVEKLCKTISL